MRVRGEYKNTRMVYLIALVLTLLLITNNQYHKDPRGLSPQISVFASTSRLELLILGLLVAAALGEHIQVVLLEEAQVLAGLGELPLFHTLTDIPVDERALRVHQVELGNQALAEDAADGDVVGDHDHVARGVGDVVPLDPDRGLVVEANLETGGAPVDKGDLVVGLDPLGDLVGLLGSDISSVVEGDGHVLVFGDIEVLVFDKE